MNKTCLCLHLNHNCQILAMDAKLPTTSSATSTKWKDQEYRQGVSFRYIVVSRALVHQRRTANRHQPWHIFSWWLRSPPLLYGRFMAPSKSLSNVRNSAPFPPPSIPCKAQNIFDVFKTGFHCIYAANISSPYLSPLE